MDDAVKTQSQTQQPQQPVQQVVQPANPVGGPKEMPRIGNEWVAPSVPEVVLPQEVQEAGVEVQPVIPQVSPSAQQAGVAHAKEATPVETVKVEPINLKTPRSVLDHLKAAHKSVKDSLSWLVRLIIKEQDREVKSPIK